MTAKQLSHLAAFETSSLINKFKSLWSAGIDANLFLETKAGKAWGTLRVCLGDHPLRHQPPPPQQERSHDSPARRRRRERREAARAEAETVISEAIDTPEEEVEIVDDSFENTTDEAATGEVSYNNETDDKAEEAPQVFDKTRVEETPEAEMLVD